jgi:formylglycine-generating enzyme required for sulfatase activity
VSAKKLKTGLILSSVIFVTNILHAEDRAGVHFENSIGIKMTLIPVGSFIMGSPFDEKGRQEDEFPHPVTISKPFYISVTEITQAQWRAMAGPDKSYFKGDSLPMEKVSWQEAQAFCQKLSQKEGKIYRLPTEAEWEYACRVPSSSSTTDALPLDEMGWYAENSNESTHIVAGKKANGWGLFDMLGNVAEWCADYYSAEYPTDTTLDPQGPAQGTYRVMRGGSWASFPNGCRCAGRSDAPGSYQLKQTGFRVVLEK